MKPPTKPLRMKPRQGHEDPEGDGEDFEDYELSESEASTLNCHLRSPQKLDMLYSYIWQHMQPLVKQQAKVKASPRKVRAKERAR